MPEEQLYIRVEDTVAITATGRENLTAACPRGIDEIETLLRHARAGGLLQHLPPLAPLPPCISA